MGARAKRGGGGGALGVVAALALAAGCLYPVIEPPPDVPARACASTPECREGEVCVRLQGRGECHKSCEEGVSCPPHQTCHECLSTQDCPACHVCVAACL